MMSLCRIHVSVYRKVDVPLMLRFGSACYIQQLRSITYPATSTDRCLPVTGRRVGPQPA